MLPVRIAGLSVHMTNADTAFFSRRLQDYADSGDGPADLCVTVTLPKTVMVPAGQELLRHETRRVIQLENGWRCRCLYGRQTGRLLQAITYAPDFSEAHIQILASRAHPELSLTDWEYLLTGSVFADRLVYLGGLVLHSSALAFDGNGIAFSAPSGTGKSTHTGLWQQLYGDRVVILNDDKPAIRWDDAGQPVLYGTPWSGKTDRNVNACAPLRALVFLEQQPCNTIRRLTAAEAMLRLTRELLLPYYDESLGRRALNTAVNLLQEVPVFLLGCTPDAEAVETVQRVLEFAKGSEKA